MSVVRNYIACMGDSITSDEVTGIGTLVSEILRMKLIGNFAHGNASCSDWYYENERLTKLEFEVTPNCWYADNVLSNQVLSLLRSTTPVGHEISWHHPIDGYFCADAEGTGINDNTPDVIYIAVGANDGKLEKGNATPVFDDCDYVFEQPYSKLTRKGIASALRWAVETLQCAYHDAIIFAASPLQAISPWEPSAFAYDALNKKRSIIKKVCEFCSINFIDSFAQAGFSQMRAKLYGDECGVHPINDERERIARFIAHKIRMELY